jgi:hypothetical protein
VFGLGRPRTDEDDDANRHGPDTDDEDGPQLEPVYLTNTVSPEELAYLIQDAERVEARALAAMGRRDAANAAKPTVSPEELERIEARALAANAWLLPTLELTPEAARTEQPVQQQPIRVWTLEVAKRTAAGQAPVSRRMAHEFLAAWRAKGRYPDTHIEDLTDSAAFNWVAYLVGHPYAAYVFGRGGICKFEIRYLRPQDTNTRDYRCDFVAYRVEGDAIRLHPGSSAEAIPVWSPDIRALAMDWSLADPLPGYGICTREEYFGGIPVFRHISDSDRMNRKMIQAWLTDELSRPELRNITVPAADGSSWFPWPLLLASVKSLSSLSLAGVTKVATCKLDNGTIGLFFRTREEVVIVQMVNNSLTVEKGDMALRHVVDVASP